MATGHSKAFRPLIVVATVLLALLSLRAEAQDAAAQTSWSADLEAAVSREREAQGLPPVESSAAVRKAAQAHVEDMARKGYFALEGPAGSPTIEALLDAEGYPFTLVTEKLARVPGEQTIEGLVK